jgi:hypothetical protein
MIEMIEEKAHKSLNQRKKKRKMKKQHKIQIMRLTKALIKKRLASSMMLPNTTNPELFHRHL